MLSKNPAKGVAWDLNNIYKGTRDPKIKSDKKLIQKLTDDFTKRYKGKINKATIEARGLRKAIVELEAIKERLYVYLNFASYLHSKDTKDPKIGAFYQEAQEFATSISASLLWFNLEIQKLPEINVKKLLKSPSLEQYSHHIKHLRVFSPFRKSLAEEEIITKMSQSGADAFVRFYDEKSASDEFVFQGNKLSYAQIAAIMKDDPSLKNRKEASLAYTKNFKSNQKFYTYILNTLLLDKKIVDEIRGYTFPQQATFLGYEVQKETVDALVATVSRNYKLCERYYKSKAKILGRRLYEWDRYSRLYTKKSEKPISWKEAKEIVLTSFSKFDSQFARVAEMFFENGWIDAEISASKRSGAFCSLGTPSTNPYVFLSFTGTIDDVMTLAHELGHAVHAYLSKKNTLNNYFPSTATAEIASVFAESLVFDHLYNTIKNDKDKLNLLANRIQGAFATIFRQIAFYQFEEEIHLHRRQKGELSVDDFNNYFQNRLKAMFGHGLTLTDNHKYWWMPILHFYHYNFYVFTYAFGEALTMALYQKYKDEGQNFVKNYKTALKKGGSTSPENITKIMGVNISDDGFWQNGIVLLSEYVKEFESLAKMIK